MVRASPRYSRELLRLLRLGSTDLRVSGSGSACRAVLPRFLSFESSAPRLTSGPELLRGL
jgi:hypothetical protein